MPSATSASPTASLLGTALRPTLVKRLEDEPVFDVLFDRCFPVTRAATPAAGRRSRREPGPAGDDPARGRPTARRRRPRRPSDSGLARTELLEALLAALRAGDDEALHARWPPPPSTPTPARTRPPGSERYFLFRVLRALDLAALVSAAARADRAEALAGRSRAPTSLRCGSAVTSWRGGSTSSVSCIAAEIRRRLPRRPTLAPARRLDDLDLRPRLHPRPARPAPGRASRWPASWPRSVAARRRLHRRGRLEVRRTIRRSLGAGGVPIEPAFRRRRASKPELVVLCDLSGSVAEFAAFTLGLVHALHNELARSRTFVFVDGVAEVTDLRRPGATACPSVRNLLSRAGVVAGDGHSDYGRVFERFWHDHARHGVGPSTTVIVTGDARTNYRGAGLDAFRLLCDRAKRVYWLNPEPRADWDTTDSVIGLYAPTLHERLRGAHAAPARRRGRRPSCDRPPRLPEPRSGPRGRRARRRAGGRRRRARPAWPWRS